MALSDYYYPNVQLPERTQYDFVPETNSWASEIINDSPLKASHMKLPVPLNESTWKIDGSIEDLLFNYTFDHPVYSIYYRVVNPLAITDANLKKRQYLYAGQLTIYLNDIDNWYIPWDSTNTADFAMDTEIIPDRIPDDTISTNPLFDTSMIIDLNIFDITFGERDMLDLLYKHKTGHEVDLTPIDFSILPSNLSKLIYAYLKVEVYNDYTFFTDVQNLTTSDDRVLVQLYEKYVNDHYYRRFELRPSFPKNEFEPELLNTDSTSAIMVVTDSQISQKYIEFYAPTIPYGTDGLFVVFNADKQIASVDYNYTLELIDSTSVFSALTWDGLALDGVIKAGDYMYVMWGYVSDFEDII